MCVILRLPGKVCECKLYIKIKLQINGRQWEGTAHWHTHKCKVLINLIYLYCQSIVMPRRRAHRLRGLGTNTLTGAFLWFALISILSEEGGWQIEKLEHTVAPLCIPWLLLHAEYSRATLWLEREAGRENYSVINIIWKREGWRGQRARWGGIFCAWGRERERGTTEGENVREERECNPPYWLDLSLWTNGFNKGGRVSGGRRAIRHREGEEGWERVRTLHSQPFGCYISKLEGDGAALAGRTGRWREISYWVIRGHLPYLSLIFISITSPSP